MAKKLITYYTFDPGTNTIRVKGNIPSKRLLLVTNITDNVNIYSFSDAFLGLVSRTYDETTEESVFVLRYDCSAMSSEDELQIFYEKDYVAIEPSETYVDAVSKFRVSNPENLIDTDFEYGPQASKWETIQTINNIPSFYASTADTTIPFITKVEATDGSEIITVTCEFEHGLVTGVPITVTGLSSLSAEGSYLIQSVPSNETFTYKGRAAQSETKELQGTYTSIIPGKFFQGAQVNLEPTKGITSDLFTKVVTVKNTTILTATTTFDIDVEVGQPVSGQSSGASGTIAKVDGVTITIIDVTGNYSEEEVISVTGAAADYTLETSANSGVAAGGNKYFLNNYLEPDFNLARNAVYIFDQSDASNTTHPIAFNDQADGAGTALTQYVYTVGTPGSAGAYTRVLVTTTSPSYNTVHYHCTNHSGMGGTANTPTADTWGALGWNTNRWGTDEAFSLGWGAQAWNDSEWGELNDAVVSLTSPGSITSAIGSVSVSAQIAVGWGQDGWGVENWGESGLVVELEAPNALTTIVGCGSAWNQGTYGQQGWGVFALETADVIGLTGVASTAGIGSPTIISSPTFALTGISATTNVGSITPADVVGISGLSSISAVGSISPADVIGISGISSTSNVGSITINSSPILNLSGQAITSAVGAIDPSAQVVGITGVSFTASVGSLVPADVIGLTGQEFTASVAAFGTSTGFGIQAYQSVDTGSNISYSDVATGTNITYKDVA